MMMSKRGYFFKIGVYTESFVPPSHSPPCQGPSRTSQRWWQGQSFKGMGIKTRGVGCIGLEAREEATCHFQVPLRPSVRAYSLPSEVNLSSGGDTA